MADGIAAPHTAAAPPGAPAPTGHDALLAALLPAVLARVRDEVKVVEARQFQQNVVLWRRVRELEAIVAEVQQGHGRGPPADGPSIAAAPAAAPVDATAIHHLPDAHAEPPVAADDPLGLADWVSGQPAAHTRAVHAQDRIGHAVPVTTSLSPPPACSPSSCAPPSSSSSSPPATSSPSTSQTVSACSPASDVASPLPAGGGCAASAAVSRHRNPRTSPRGAAHSVTPAGAADALGRAAAAGTPNGTPTPTAAALALNRDPLSPPDERVMRTAAVTAVNSPASELDGGSHAEAVSPATAWSSDRGVRMSMSSAPSGASYASSPGDLASLAFGAGMAAHPHASLGARAPASTADPTDSDTPPPLSGGGGHANMVDPPRLSASPAHTSTLSPRTDPVAPWADRGGLESRSPFTADEFVPSPCPGAGVGVGPGDVAVDGAGSSPASPGYTVCRSTMGDTATAGARSPFSHSRSGSGSGSDWAVHGAVRYGQGTPPSMAARPGPILGRPPPAPAPAGAFGYARTVPVAPQRERSVETSSASSRGGGVGVRPRAGTGGPAAAPQRHPPKVDSALLERLAELESRLVTFQAAGGTGTEAWTDVARCADRPPTPPSLSSIGADPRDAAAEREQDLEGMLEAEVEAARPWWRGEAEMP